MRFFVDTADVDQIRKANDMGVVFRFFSRCFLQFLSIKKNSFFLVFP